jgi:D-glycero-alpha-D-manno-heptose 1-phosphate guanylyltransferase
LALSAPTTAIILAGGLGTRLQSVVSDRPKALALVAGRPFLYFLLDQLADAGIKDVVLCVGHRADQVRQTMGDHHRGMVLRYSLETEPLGTGGALRLALDACTANPLLVANGDSILRTDLRTFFTWHATSGAKASVLLAQVPDAARFGRVEVDPEGHILHFMEKDGRSHPGAINAGYYLIDRSWISQIPAGRMVSLETEVFPTWIGREFFAKETPGIFLDIGTPESYMQAESTLASGHKAER